MTEQLAAVRRSRVRGPKQDRSRSSMERLLAAAVKMLVQRGYSEFTLQELSKRAKVSIGSIYLRFENKQALIREVEHLLGDVGVDPFPRAGLQDELADAARTAPHVEHSRRLVFTDDVEREVAALQQSRTNRTLERMLLVVERVKRGRLFAKVISDELRSVR